jgi:hypothetical protein
MRSRLGGGTVHHVAFRARTDEEQKIWREQIVSLGFNVTPILDRQYFRSIYFREPGYVERIWLRTLRRRSQKDRFSWQRMHRLAAGWIPKPFIRILTSVSPSHTQGGSRVRKSRPHGSGRGRGQ